MGKIKRSSFRSVDETFGLVDLKDIYEFKNNVTSNGTVVVEGICLMKEEKKEVDDFADSLNEKVEDEEITFDETEEYEDYKYHEYDEYYEEDFEDFDDFEDEEMSSSLLVGLKWEATFNRANDKRQSNFHDKSYMSNRLRSKQKNKEQKVNADRYQSARNYKDIRAGFEEYYIELKKSNSARKYASMIKSPTYSRPSSTSQTKTHNHTHHRRSQEDEDLQRALEASHQEHLLVSTARETGLNTNVLRDLQNRELTPEDYELLLLLDKQVKPKTLTVSDIQKFPSRTVCESSKDMCTVCMCEFEIGEVLKILPCKHEFHVECITQWLTGSSVNCPIDNLAVK